MGAESSEREAPPHNDTDTSKNAAASVRPKAQTLRSLVFKAISAHGDHGATADELEVELGLAGSTLRPRIWELNGKDRKRPELKRIHDTGTRRKTRSGRAAAVYSALPLDTTTTESTK